VFLGDSHLASADEQGAVNTLVTLLRDVDIPYYMYIYIYIYIERERESERGAFLC
jgi:hypothetical protein